MHIPVLYHTFDATGLSMHFSKTTYVAITIAIISYFIILAFLPHFITYFFEKPEMSFRKWFDKKRSKSASMLFFTIPVMASAIFIPSATEDIPKFFTSGAEGKEFLKPNIVNGKEYPTGFDPEYYKKWGYDEKNSLVNKYSEEFKKAIENNSQLNQYHIPECELNNAQSILCGGDTAEEVVANKGDTTVILQPHFSTKEKDAQLILDNPKDRGVKVYFWVEEREDKGRK